MSSSNHQSEQPKTTVKDVTRLLEPYKNRYQKVWIAYSGGLDSTVLLQCAAKLLDRRVLNVLHVNHHLSDQADAWQSHCEEVANELLLNLTVHHVQLQGQNVELAGRKARLEIFKDILGPNVCVFTAHHADDELESFFWQMATGRAMVGIPGTRDLGLTGGQLVRPLLSLNKQNLLDVAKTEEWSWIEDTSNQDTQFNRNFIRHDILPKLETRFPGFGRNLRKLRTLPLISRPQGPLKLEAGLTSQKILREWAFSHGILPTLPQLREIERQIEKDPDRVRVDLGGTHIAWSFNRYLSLVETPIRERTQFRESGEGFSCQFGQVVWERRAKGLRLGLKLKVKFLVSEEVIEMNDRSRTLRRWLWLATPSPWERVFWPVLFFGSEVVAIPGIDVASKYLDPDGLFPAWRSKSSEL